MDRENGKSSEGEGWIITKYNDIYALKTVMEPTTLYINLKNSLKNQNNLEPITNTKIKAIPPDGNVETEEYEVPLVTGGSYTHHFVTFHLLLKSHGAWNLYLLFLVNSFDIKVLSIHLN